MYVHTYITVLSQKMLKLGKYEKQEYKTRAKVTWPRVASVWLLSNCYRLCNVKKKKKSTTTTSRQRLHMKSHYCVVTLNTNCITNSTPSHIHRYVYLHLFSTITSTTSSMTIAMMMMIMMIITTTKCRRCQKNLGH